MTTTQNWSAEMDRKYKMLRDHPDEYLASLQPKKVSIRRKLSSSLRKIFKVTK